MPESIYLYRLVSLSSSSSHIRYIPILITVIPHHIISPIHCIEYTALLKTLHSAAMPL
jgi:hypothetical protein